MNIELIKDKYFTVPSNVIKCINKDLSLCDFFLIMYLINNLDNRNSTEENDNNINGWDNIITEFKNSGITYEM